MTHPLRYKFTIREFIDKFVVTPATYVIAFPPALLIACYRNFRFRLRTFILGIAFVCISIVLVPACMRMQLRMNPKHSSHWREHTVPYLEQFESERPDEFPEQLRRIHASWKPSPWEVPLRWHRILQRPAK